MLNRYSGNPIVSAVAGNPFFPKKVYNPTVVKRLGRYHLIFRAVGADWISRLFLAESLDGVHFTVHDRPMLSPEIEGESRGCEDPRAVYIDGKYYLTYTAFDGTTARAAMATSDNLAEWTNRHLLFPRLQHYQRENLPGDWSKAAAIIPEKVGDWYYLLFGDNHIWPARSRDLLTWESSSTPVLDNRPGYFDAAYVEMGPPPIRTSRGWLVLYHGIDAFTQQRTYCLGAALLDLEDPTKVLWRCKRPILVPSEPYEVIGLIDLLPDGYKTLKTITVTELYRLHVEGQLPKAVFCCGALLEGEELRLYYGAADTCICTATIDLTTVFNS